MKILTIRAHCGHQYELWKLGHEFHVATGFGQSLDHWVYGQRPLHSNAKFIDYRQINPDDYDFCILHFDESMVRPGHPATPETWGTSFRWLMEVSKNIPRAAICHGTPQFKEMGDITKRTLDITVYEDRKKKTVEFLGDTLVICNSNQAREEWGFKKSKTIWHGFDPKEFKKGRNNLEILSPSLGALKQRPHYRGWFIQEEVMKKLPKDISISHTSVPEPAQTQDPNVYARKKFNCYINAIGKYSVYLNTTWLSPMPRSRGEAMMCGLVSVNCDTHDASIFIENGVNGFVENDPDEIVQKLIWLHKNTYERQKMSLASRQTAVDKFHIDRYLNEWKQTINDVVGGNY